jgi:hypothetical protein
MMIKEAINVRQIKGDLKRRWFSSDYFDLIVWYSEEGQINGFQLCYDKDRNERAITWKTSIGYSHNRIDDGENHLGVYKATPILIADGAFDRHMIATAFKRESKNIEKDISVFIHKKLLEFNGI